MDTQSLTLILPPDYSAQRRSAGERRIQQVVELLEGRAHILILMHNDPDPDAIASSRGIEELVRACLPDAGVTLAHGGMLGRAENRTMASLFAPHALHIPTAEAEERLATYDAILMVDTQPNAGNNLLYGAEYPLENVVLAVDHHPPKRSQVRAVVHDVRPDVGASSTIVAEYLAIAETPVDSELATALFYGIKSDTRGLSRHTSDLDLWAYSTLRNRVDTDLLNEIEHVQLPRSYYRSLSDALANTTLYHCEEKDAASPHPNQPDEGEEEPAYACSGDVAVSLLFDMQHPDMASEVADLLLRMENVSWALCLGIYQDRLVISVRTDDPGTRAGRLVRSIVGRSGAAGGHDTMAGGRIHLPDETPPERIAELHLLVPRFLNQLGAGKDAGVPLLEAREG